MKRMTVGIFVTYLTFVFNFCVTMHLLSLPMQFGGLQLGLNYTQSS